MIPPIMAYAIGPQKTSEAIGINAKLAAAGRTSDKKAPDEILLEAKGFIGKSDSRLSALAESAGEGLARIVPIGGFANPAVIAGASNT